MLNRLKSTAKEVLMPGAAAGAVLFVLLAWSVPGAFAQVCDPLTALPGGTLNPCDVTKYVIPLVIPPVMNNAGQPDDYDIAVRQFGQQILPGGIWEAFDPGNNYPNFPATTVWSYGPADDPLPDASGLGLPAGVAPAPNSQFNYPAYTVETLASDDYGPGAGVSVRWINDLVDAHGNFLPHLLAIDQTLHWANPPKRDCRVGDPNRTDCATTNQDLYLGPVPIVTHVHGAHVDPHSDGYPEAWWLPAAKNIPAGYATSGTLFDDATGTNPGNLGYADYFYRQDQPATTLWYHDHSLGMTRSNVYAGPAGFWLVRGGDNDIPPDNPANQLPGPAPVYGEGVVQVNFPSTFPDHDLAGEREKYREIPIVIQDRSFNANGAELFYPANRAFFEGLGDGQTPGVPGDIDAGLDIPFIPDPTIGGGPSDVAPIWNPEAFFNIMVVNGVSWPTHDVAQALYRFRLLDGCNSRFLNLALFVVNPDGTLGQEIPFYQIGAEQGFLPNVVRIQTGEAVVLPGDGSEPLASSDPGDPTALLMGPAERADVIVDFRGLPDGTIVRMINTAPDAPFGGFPDDPADPGTTGQVMQFVVNAAYNGQSPTDPEGPQAATDPWSLNLPAENPGADADLTRELSLNEEESATVCALFDPVADAFVEPIEDVDCTTPSPTPGGFEVVPFGPTAALLGIINAAGDSVALTWSDDITENPLVGDTEQWDIYNLTADAHPIHLHLVRFEVVDRQDMVTDPVTGEVVQPVDVVPGTTTPPEAWETGFKDTVIAYPGQVTRIKSLFDIVGLYVWHCHIVEHEDNEMMRPYIVRHTPDINGDGMVDRTDLALLLAKMRERSKLVSVLAFDLNGDGVVNLLDARYLRSHFGPVDPS